MSKSFESPPPAQWNFDRAAIASLLDKVGRHDRAGVMPVEELTFDRLKGILNEQEAGAVDMLLAIDPKEVGFTGPFITLEGPPADLLPVSNQSYMRDGKEIVIPTQHLPQAAINAFHEIGEAIHQDIGSSLMIESGYRSPAYQAVIFLIYLEKHGYDIKGVARGVALPGYSQHGDPENTALDVLNQDGVQTDDWPGSFAETKEYEWLVDNAANYDFHLSYPGDVDGIKFEPWHWRYISPSQSKPV